MATLCTLVASAVLSHPMRFASFMWVCTACIIPHPSCGCLFCRADCSGSRFYKWGMFLCFVIAPETQGQTPPQQKSTHFMRFCESIAQSQVHALMALWCSEQRTIALYLAIKCPCAGHVWLSAQCVYWGEPAIETNRRQKLETNSLIVLDFDLQVFNDLPRWIRSNAGTSGSIPVDLCIDWCKVQHDLLSGWVEFQSVGLKWWAKPLCVFCISHWVLWRVFNEIVPHARADHWHIFSSNSLDA